MLDPGFALYIHWPFCKSKCPYCDFNSHVRDGIEQERWRSALLAELDHAAGETAGRRVTSVFLGGGTPWLMEAATVAALLDGAASRWAMAEDLEVTREENPTSVEAARFAALRQAGVNRLSLGVQALDDRALRFLGRGHDAAEARAALALAERHFARYSFDLIYARPEQTLAQWQAEPARAVERQGHGLQERVALTPVERREEMLMMGLRLSEGVARARFRAETGAEIEASLDGERLADLVGGGFLAQDAHGLRATAAGRQRLNAVLAALAA